MSVTTSVKGVIRLRNRLIAELEQDGAKDTIAQRVRKILGIPTKTIGLVMAEAEPLLVNPVTRRSACWRLAGSKAWLKRGLVVGAESWKSDSHWAVVTILDVIRMRRYDKPGARVRMRIMTGLSAGTVVEKFWSRSMLFMMARKCGFSTAGRDRPMTDPRELGGMRFLGYMDPAKISRDLPGFSRVKVSGSLKSRNIKMLKSRRLSDRVCEYRIPLTVMCYQCPVGRDSCEISTHSETFVKKLCTPCCGEVYHDPADDELCVICRSKRSYQERFK
jgi:hypothetical protein